MLGRARSISRQDKICQAEKGLMLQPAVVFRSALQPLFHNTYSPHLGLRECLGSSMTADAYRAPSRLAKNECCYS